MNEAKDYFKILKLNNHRSAVNIVVEPGKTIIFPQYLPHQGMNYSGENLRIFSYFDLVEFKLFNVRQEIN